MTAENLIALAKSEVGTKEFPAGSNRVKYNTAYYGREVSGDDYPWCCVFLWWLFREGGASALFYGGGKTASCGALASYAKAHGLWVEPESLRPGDLVFLRFSGSVIQHIGLVAQNRGVDGLLTIEGNTGAGSDANGGEVQIRVRAMKFTVGGFRPRYEEEQTMVKQQTAVQTVYETLNDVPQTFRGVISALMTAGILQGDGGGKLNLTHEMVRTLTLVYRGGGFDRKLAAAGLESAVKE